MMDEPPEPPENTNLTKRTTGSAAWLISVRLFSKSIDFVNLLVIARFLSPADFGIVAIAMTLVLLTEAVFEMPVSQILVSLPSISRQELDTAFSLSLLRGILLSGTLWALAIPFADFYRDSRLSGLIFVLSSAPVLRAMINPRLAEFAKRLDFRREMILDVGNKVVSFLYSSVAAWEFRDYRALMVGIVASPLTLLVLSYALAPYRPGFSLKGWPSFSGLVGWTTATQLLTALNWQCDRLFLARLVSRTDLGGYSLANDLSFIPEQALIKPIVRPLLSAFTLIRDDPDRIRSAYGKTSISILAVGLPVMLALCILADPAVHFLLGAKWVAAIPALRLLPLTLIPPLFTSPFSSLAMAKNRFDLVFRLVIAESFSKFPFMAVGAILFGITGAIAARALSATITAAYVLYFIKMLTGEKIRRQIEPTWRIVVSGGVSSIVWLILGQGLVGRTGIYLGIHLVIVTLIGLAAYAVSITVLWYVSGRPLGLEEVILGRAHSATIKTLAPLRRLLRR